MYVDGLGVKAKNNKLAMQWYRKAADKGYPPAIYSVGAMYANGFGIRQDYKQARQWFMKAAKLGFPRAKQALQKLNQMKK